MSATVVTDPDLDAIEAAARAQIGRLEQARARLSLDALRDPDVREEVADIEHQISDAEREIERIALARTEGERRERQAVVDAEAERRAVALKEAEKFHAQRLKAAKAADEAAAVYAAKLRQWDQLTTAEEGALRRAGRPADADAARPRSWQIEAALRYAIVNAGNQPSIVRLEAFSGGASVGPRNVRPLAESEAPLTAPEGVTRLPDAPPRAPVSTELPLNILGAYGRARDGGSTAEEARAYVARTYGRDEGDSWLREECERAEARRARREAAE